MVCKYIKKIDTTILRKMFYTNYVVCKSSLKSIKKTSASSFYTNYVVCKLSSRHVYDHGTLGLVQVINTHLLLFKANYQPPDNSKVYLSISTNGCLP